MFGRQDHSIIDINDGGERRTQSTLSRPIQSPNSNPLCNSHQEAPTNEIHHTILSQTRVAVLAEGRKEERKWEHGAAVLGNEHLTDDAHAPCFDD